RGICRNREGPVRRLHHPVYRGDGCSGLARTSTGLRPDPKNDATPMPPVTGQKPQANAWGFFINYNVLNSANFRPLTTKFRKRRGTNSPVRRCFSMSGISLINQTSRVGGNYEQATCHDRP